MDKWWFLLTRTIVTLTVAALIGAIIAFVPYLTGFPYLPVGIPLSHSLGIWWFLGGAILMVFGGCQAIGFTERMAIVRYAGNPPVTRDSVRHFHERQHEQRRSGPALFLAGLILVISALLLLTFLPF